MSNELKAKIYDLSEELAAVRSVMQEQFQALVEIAAILEVKPDENNDVKLENIIAAAKQLKNEMV